MKTFFTLLFIIFDFSCFGQTKTYSIVFLNKNPDSEQMPKELLAKIMEGHTANRIRLHKEGKLLAAGPFDGGGGMYILNTTSVDEARQWVSDDPGVQANRWSIEIFPYKISYGGICRVSEPYEMVNYHFIRFNAVVSKFTASNYPQIIQKHNEYLKQLTATGNVITEAKFDENKGGIIVIKGDLQRDVIEADPGVQEGLLELDIKKLYIAKGSLCEK